MVKKKTKVIAIIQDRYNSIRLKGKILKKISKYSSIELVYKRLKKSKLIEEIIIATSGDITNKPFVDFLKKKKYEIFRR